MMNYKIEATTPDEIGLIAKLEAEMYSSRDAVPEDILRAWYSQNPNGFSTIKYKGQVIGHVDLLPLKSNVLGRFRDGVITEQEIRGSDLFSAEESELVRTVYVESVALAGSNGLTRAQAVKHVLLNAIDLVSRVGDPQRIENIFAVAATSSGKRFLKALGFSIVSSAQDRRDQHDLYATRLACLEGEIHRRFASARIRRDSAFALAEI
jgi:hypothetical protein